MVDFHAGDILLFHGDNFASTLIALGSCWPSQWIRGVTPSHAAVIANHDGKPMLFESTSLCDLPCEIQGRPVSGVQCHTPERRVDVYRGKVWCMRPVCPPSRWKSEALTRFCESCIGKSYDSAGLLETGSLLRYARFWTPPAKSMICSRYVMLALRAAYMVGQNVAPVEWSPARIERDLTHEELWRPVERVK